MHERLTIGPELARGVLITAHDDIAKDAVRRNAEASVDWEYHEAHQFLMRWAWRFKDELIDGVALLDRRRLPDPVISFDNLRNVNILAAYRLARNPQGLLDEIVFNTAHFEETPEGLKWRFGEWEMLETLCHEQLHLKQQNFGAQPVKNNYHNKEFCQMAEAIGLHPLPIFGCHYAPADGAFAALLTKYGIRRPPAVEVPKGEKRDWWEVLPGKERKEGKSTLTKWECACGQKARVGKKEFYAICTKCGSPFVKVEGKASRSVKANETKNPPGNTGGTTEGTKRSIA